LRNLKQNLEASAAAFPGIAPSPMQASHEDHLAARNSAQESKKC